MELNGRIALITGTARRIGRELALGLAQEGAHIALHYRQSSHEALYLADEIYAMGGRVRLFPADLQLEEEAIALPTRVTAAMGAPTLLINNASIFEEGSLLNTTADQWHRHLAINLTAPFFLMQTFAREILTHSQNSEPTVQGKIINLLDQRVAHPKPGHLAYTVSKCALHTLTTLAAQELAPHILVNAIGPGAILPANPADPHAFQQIAAASPLARAGAVGDILDTTLFLLKQDYITGQLIHVDGGKHLL
ncbi:MAG: SDR family oxidoreductase [Magnetococcales bacterium]|nr:SDR family oxidoreductase [Magnetococcales bacterium]NGZ26738.1 SDR family oxidoreductase [Magnetococcales bacterium]